MTQYEELDDQESNRRDDRPSDRPSDQALLIMKLLIDGPKSREDIMKELGLNHIPTFRKNYLHNALENGWIERTIPDKPTASNQQYQLIAKGDQYMESYKIGVRRFALQRVPAYGRHTLNTDTRIDI